MVELLEKYLTMAVSMVILVSLSTPILKDGGELIDDCYRTVLVKVLIEEVDFGISETIRTGRPFEGIVLIPSNLRIRSEDTRLILSFLAFKRRVTLSRHYSKPLCVKPPIADGRHLLYIASIDETTLITFRLI